MECLKKKLLIQKIKLVKKLKIKSKQKIIKMNKKFFYKLNTTKKKRTI